MYCIHIYIYCILFYILYTARVLEPSWNIIEKIIYTEVLKCTKPMILGEVIWDIYFKNNFNFGEENAFKI